MREYDLYWLHYVYQSGKNVDNIKKRPVLVIEKGRVISLALEVEGHSPVVAHNR